MNRPHRRTPYLIATALASVLVMAPLGATASTAPDFGPTSGQDVLSDAPDAGLPTQGVAPWMPPQQYNGEVKGIVGSWAGYTNGMIPVEVLCSPSWTSTRHRSRCDADAALEEMNAAYRAAFGVNLSITSTYRTYDEQVQLKIEKPTLAATPGTSNHGWGLAIDFGGGINVFGSAQHNWMRQNANRFGWFHPQWAQYDGSLPEAWHWEYAGSIASGRTDQNRLLAMELTRTQPWDGSEQRQCLADLWQLRSGWDHRAVGDVTSLRGIPQLDLVTLFGSTWATSKGGTAYLRIPQRQIEHGLRDITSSFDGACDAWRHWGPRVSFELPEQTTVPAGGTVRLMARYDKLLAPVPSAELMVQSRTVDGWVDVAPVRIVDGVGEHLLSPGSVSTEYRLRNWNGSAVTDSFKVYVAELGATLTGPGTVPATGTSTVSVTYTKDARPVPSAVVTLQRLTGGAWEDVEDVSVVSGQATHEVRPGATTGTFRLRNWNTTTVTNPFTVAVAELKAVVDGPTEIPANTLAEMSVSYTKDSVPVATASLHLQVLRDGSWVDVLAVPVTSGNATVRLDPGITTTTYRLRNWNSTTVTEPITVTVLAPVFTDVSPDHPFKASIDWLVLSGVAEGYDDGSFRPGTAVARQAMAAFLYRSAGSPAYTPPVTSPFVDVTPASPFYREITWLAAQGITTGTPMPDGTVQFQPAAPVSRGAMAAFLYRFVGSPQVQGVTTAFSDVLPGTRFAQEITWISANGISTGTAGPDGSVQYRPGDPVSRQAMAAFLHRLDRLGD